VHTQDSKGVSVLVEAFFHVAGCAYSMLSIRVAEEAARHKQDSQGGTRSILRAEYMFSQPATLVVRGAG
jgi:hypothetical protein